MKKLNNSVKIRVAKEDEVDVLADLLSTSFCYDPAFTWMTEDHTKRFEALIGFFQVYIKLGIEKGIVHIAETNNMGLVGASIWLPHDASDEKVESDVMNAVGIFGNQFELFGNLLSPSYPPAMPYFQLMAVGVHPTAHGIGIGSSLLMYQLDEFDKMGVSTYLEASTRRSAGGIYQRLNYQPVGEIINFPNDTEICPMWRIALKQDASSDLGNFGNKEYPLIDSIVNFGKYKWRVLDVQQDMALILCDRVIESRKYNEQFEPTTWAASSLRKFLNTEFYQNFSKSEQERIANARISTYSNPWFGTDGGEETMDYVFLLDIDGVVKYFGDSKQLRSRNANTKYFINDHFNGARRTMNTDGITSSWWLRSSGNNPHFAANVSSDGRIAVSGDFVNRENAPHAGIRPALWLKI